MKAKELTNRLGHTGCPYARNNIMRVFNADSRYMRQIKWKWKVSF